MKRAHRKEEKEPILVLMHLLFGLMPVAAVAVVGALVADVEKPKEAPGAEWLLGHAAGVGALAGVLVFLLQLVLPASVTQSDWGFIPALVLGLTAVVITAYKGIKPIASAWWAIVGLCAVVVGVYTITMIVQGAGDGTGLDAVFYPLFWLFFGAPALASAGLAGWIMRKRRDAAPVEPKSIQEDAPFVENFDEAEGTTN